MVLNASEPPDGAESNVNRTKAWLSAVRIYLAIIAVGNLLWEAAHLPLYTIWTTGSMREQTFAVVHCTGGDLLIATSSLVMALILVGDSQWPGRRFFHVAGLTMLLGVGYTIFSEWLNIIIRQSWAYSDLMPVVTILGFKVGLSPVFQWIIIPSFAFWMAARYSSDIEVLAESSRPKRFITQ
ncbi:hypothetical protein [Bosea sp. (in: a-proteobacteria)]|uniref:hypothetical protein n=1 Tax=Bosea sp. (in: a-proteobacteria) TaxID=1871050 RepID=UPI00273299E8|nr:hypothetical protein [Bosea sp. (in: a-proteobacteria)]MDP3407316.1 hypothetical protein [Bosea sp. (in: a-proteobacteria)]